MRNKARSIGAFLKSSVNGSSVGWSLLWALALLALPTCGLSTDVTFPGSHVNRGSGPHTSAVLCDIEKEESRHCALADEITKGVRLAEAAVALVAGHTSNPGLGLDDSPAALANCAATTGGPQAVQFQGQFPEGSPVCLDCSVIGPSPSPHPTSDAVCVALCKDFFSAAFCEDHAHAHISTNFPTTGCFADACTGTEGDKLRSGFADRRRIPEPVTWGDVTSNASAAANNLTRVGANPSNMWDAGAASKQVIKSGDGYVEFTATETDKARVCGLSTGGPPDMQPSFTDIGYGIDLFSDGTVRVFESGKEVKMLGPYMSGQKFRVKVKDNFNGTATISYVRITGPCVDGSPCSEEILYTSSTPGAYPFRVDASLFDQNASVTNARLVFIH